MVELNVRFLMVEPAHPRPGKSPRLNRDARIFLDLLQDLTSTIIFVVDDVPIDSEVAVVISLILRICRFSFLEMLVYP
jgi:hypothetical protein